jgi:hypothetical protein
MAAIVKNIIKASEKECFVKFQGDTGSVTLSLEELVASNVITKIALTGTASIPNGSTAITGVGSSFDTQTTIGDKIITSTGVFVGVITSLTATNITLYSTYTGTTVPPGSTLYFVHSDEIISGTPAVNIAGAVVTGDTKGNIQITRNNVVIMTLNSGASPPIDLSGALMAPDSINNTYPLVATVIPDSIGGTMGQCEVWLRLRKVDGYVRKTETTEFGAYDNPNQVGQ